MPIFTPITHDGFVDQVRVLAAQIGPDSDWRPDFIIGIGRAAVMTARAIA